MDNDDNAGRITAISDSLAAFIRTFPQAQRTEFHKNMQMISAPKDSPGYFEERNRIIGNTR